MSRRVTYFNSSFATAFHPLNLAGSQLYFAKNTATPSLWNDQSTNAYDLSQGVATQQPIISANSVDFDGVNDVLSRTGAFFSADTEGIVYFADYVTLGNSTLLGFSTARKTFNFSFFYINYTATGDIICIIRKNDFTVNNIIRTTDTFPSGFIYGYLKASGGNYELYVNGSIITFTMISGTNNGNWFNTIDVQTRLSIGALERLSVIYNPAKVNKNYYNNQPSLLSASDITKLNTFFSDPNNY